jgi:flagellar basal body P-ring protein FlgI
MQSLVDAFNLLKVSADERITIIEQLHASGALRADLQDD